MPDRRSAMSNRRTNSPVRQKRVNSQKMPPSGSTNRTTKRRKPQQPMSRSERQRRKIRRSFRRKVAGRIAFLIMTFIAAFLAVTIFFKIDTIRATATEHYTEQEIIEAIEVKTGDNLFTFRTSSLEKRLLEKFPYLASVRVTRSLPSTLVIETKDSVPAAAISLSGGGYYLIDENGKMLEQSTNIPEGVPSVTGVSIVDGSAGQYIDVKNNKKAEILVSLTKALKEHSMIENVNFINVSALTDVRIGYLGRLDVRLGQADNINEKLKMLVHIVENELSPSDIQTIYLEDAVTVYCPPTTLEKFQQSAMPISDVNSPEIT